HKTREEVAQLFAKVVGHPVPDDTASLVAVARAELRQYFLNADIGITGGNALIAETGTLLLVTNEGNADLATSVPPVHIAVVGIEKIVPTLDDAMAIVKLLARSGTGQKITTCTRARSDWSSRPGTTGPTASRTSRACASAATPATRCVPSRSRSPRSSPRSARRPWSGSASRSRSASC